MFVHSAQREGQRAEHSESTGARGSRAVLRRSAWVGALAAVMLLAAPAFAQHAEGPKGSEADRAAAGAAGDAPTANEHGSEHHTGGPSEADAEEEDPSRHFNYVGQEPGHLFDYMGKDEYGGPFGDGKMVDKATGHVIHEEEPASPPYVFMLLNFAILLGLLAWKGMPYAQKVAAERHDLIKSALDEAAKLRKQAADKLAEYEARLKDADAEIKKLVAGMQADALNDKIRIEQAAAALAAQMKRDAEQRIAAEIELARAQLTREVTAAAAAVAEKLLRDKLSAGDQQKLVSSFISDVQSSAAGRTSGPTSGKGQVT
jgi:F-type H+-transporting ATPase subunit b